MYYPMFLVINPVERIIDMPKRIVVIGAVALGPKVACRIKRIMKDAHVTVVDRDSFISYGGCGIPYYVSGDVAELEGLYSTSAHVIRDSQFFKNAKGVEVLTRTEAIDINVTDKTVHVRNLNDGSQSDLPYDELVLATGATPVVPPIPGNDLPGVSVVANLHQAKLIKDGIAAGKIGRAIVIGGGAIGIEMAEALTDLWGVKTTLVEMQPQLLPTALGPDLAQIVKNEMVEKGVEIRLSEKVSSITRDDAGGTLNVEVNDTWLSCDLVVLSVGVRPNVELARKAGLNVGLTGGIEVDRNMRTSNDTIYAGGDCVEIQDMVSGLPTLMPLGSLANRQGRVIANNIAGISSEFRGTVGTFCLKVFEMGVARAGLTESWAENIGFKPVSTIVAQADRAHFFPTQSMMLMKLIADKYSRQVLGVEAIGPNIDAVKARVDAVAVRLADKPDIEEISNLEVAYSPPFASAMDIVNSAANALDNTITGHHQPTDVLSFLDEFKKGDAKVLDVRSKIQAEPLVEKYGERWQNIPQEDLACRLAEVNQDGPLYIVCGAGTRAYEAQVLLRKHGIEGTKNIQGGIKMLKSTDPDFVPDE
jgi:NADPH-dependent 2,4-dienoyl-CoA reductase/sulfur reductase-like enzyme/rhodanese-related sulfurtransferase